MQVDVGDHQLAPALIAWLSVLLATMHQDAEERHLGAVCSVVQIVPLHSMQAGVEGRQLVYVFNVQYVEMDSILVLDVLTLILLVFLAH